MKIFEEEEKKTNLHLVADRVAEQVNKANQESIEQIRRCNREQNLRLHGCDCPAARCYVSCPRYLTHYASQAEFWHWWGKTTPPDNRDREAILHIPAPAKKSGGSKSKSKKKQQLVKDLRKYVLE